MKFTCQEGKRLVEHEITLLEPRIEKIVVLVDKIQQVPNFLDPIDPYSIFLDEENTFFLVGNVGVLGVVDPDSGSAHVHMTFWDRRLRGREGLCMELMDLVLKIGRYEFLFTAIPENNRKVVSFARRIGFRELGTHRGVLALRFDGRNHGNR